MSRRRLWRWIAAIVVLAAVALVGIGYRNATAAPVVRRLDLTVAGYPASAAPVRVLLFSDLHVHGPDMPPSRLARIVAQLNALHPDIAVAAGDFVGNNWVGRHYSVDQAIAPLPGLKARLGTFAVLGNNDYQAGADALTGALQRAGIRVLRNTAVQLGPVTLGGIDGRIYRPAAWRQARATTDAALRALPGVEVLVAHRPDEFVHAPAPVSLVLAGHTHCGQIVLPLVGALETGSDYGQKYACGVVRQGAKVLVVTAGLGTSYVPLRFGAPPDVWLIMIHGPRTRSPETM